MEGHQNCEQNVCEQTAVPKKISFQTPNRVTQNEQNESHFDYFP